MQIKLQQSEQMVGFLTQLDEIQRKDKEGDNMEEPKIDLQNTYDKQRPNEEVDVEMMNTENWPVDYRFKASLTLTMRLD